MISITFVYPILSLINEFIDNRELALGLYHKYFNISDYFNCFEQDHQYIFDFKFYNPINFFLFLE